MSVRHTAFAFVAALFFAAPAHAADPVTPAVPPQAPAAAHDDGNEIICHDTAIVGSRLQSRLCLSKRRWAQMHKDGQEFIRDIQERGEGGQSRGM
jgi:hypothetical protein